MDALFRFLVDYENYIYVLLGVGALFAFQRAFFAWRAWRMAVFGLEREMAFNRFRVSGAVFVLIVMMALVLFFAVTFVVPFLPSDTFVATPTVDILFTPLPTIPEGEVTVEPAMQTPENTTGCIPELLIITSLQADQQVSGQVSLVGTVNIPNFGFYKYEFAPRGSAAWVTIQAGNNPRIEEELGVWDVSELTPGEYQIRLVATDNQGEALEPCVIPVRVVAQ